MATVLITGAAGNLGRAVAAAFAARGAQVGLVGRRIDALRAVFGEEGPDRLFLAADLLAADQVEAAAKALESRFDGRIDALCNLAGGFAMGDSVHETDDAALARMMDLNVRTALNAMRVVVPRMLRQGGGRIVNVGAASALKGAARMGAYVASKSALIRLTETLSAEVKEQGINVNCVLPTLIDTPENRAAMPQADPARWVAPDDLAQVIVFLASEQARAVHGASVPVSGLS